MQEVTKEEFYEIIGPLDAVVNVEGQYPYVAYWRTRSGKLLGKQQNNKYYVKQGS